MNGSVGYSDASSAGYSVRGEESTHWITVIADNTNCLAEVDTLRLKSFSDFLHAHRTTAWGIFIRSSSITGFESGIRHVPKSDVASPLKGTDDLIRDLREKSGLTWDQIARLFGVSRRSVHMWANGGRLNSENFEFLSKVTTVVSGLSASSSDERRKQLLSPRGGNVSLFEELRASRTGGSQEINRSPFRPGQMLGYGDGDEE